ncbi:MAG: hypothetical protein B6D72_11415 [gamma proteobacterium symbiont of Ctena orbiculata]|nr:MAG: hypothetical protein B6D72_11415 [gamma proteobacterium symbiont of Ctena orbiculata]PVV13248.1 MAG: hypothetical protein B6D82_08335 [gamma proteobacterium symbiont of Ctena orbiculata]PVV24122.1 MAG: hypothetical protein B6D74_06170 [gamma proteobacterium symbiont of Ctena orbiculata]
MFTIPLREDPASPNDGSYYMPEQTTRNAGISHKNSRVFGDFNEYLLKVSAVIIVSITMFDLLNSRILHGTKIVKRQAIRLVFSISTKLVQPALWIVRIIKRKQLKTDGQIIFSSPGIDD